MKWRYATVLAVSFLLLPCMVGESYAYSAMFIDRLPGDSIPGESYVLELEFYSVSGSSSSTNLQYVCHGGSVGSAVLRITFSGMDDVPDGTFMTVSSPDAYTFGIVSGGRISLTLRTPVAEDDSVSIVTELSGVSSWPRGVSAAFSDSARHAVLYAHFP